MNLNAYKKDLFSTMINQLWRVIAGPVVMLFIPIYLTPVEQGYWYTFTSLAALAVFADLGFSTIILQFAAHEFAHLRFNSSRILIGDERHLWKLASFFRFSIKWLIRIIGIVFPLIVIGGYVFLNSKHDDLNWQGAWILYSVASGWVFLNSSLMCFFEGCNSVSLLQSVRLKIGVCTSIMTLLGLYFQLDLYSLSLSLMVSALVGTCLLLQSFSVTITQLWRLSSGKTYDWWPEFSSLIWRYAISWCSGYFIFQLFTPLAFKFHGAVLAGEIGLSIAMWTAGYSIASSWITAITPKLNMLISDCKWAELDRLFNKSFLYSMGTMLIGGIIFFALDFSLSKDFSFFQRLLGVKGMIFLFLCWLGQLYVNNIAVYLRSHKKEPLMQVSFFSAMYVALLTYFCAKFLSDELLFLGFFTSYIWEIPVVIAIFNKQKKHHMERRKIN